ncbi:MAG: alpha-amylase [Chlorobium sp.]|jgi:glycosidase|nr:alpha-amylase [Chlorobium sp.]
MTSNNYQPAPPGKEHFYLNRQARELFKQRDPEFLVLFDRSGDSLAHAREQTAIINSFLKKKKGDQAKLILPAQFHGMKLLHEVFHALIAQSVASRKPDFFKTVDDNFHRELSQNRANEYEKRFLDDFPPDALFRGVQSTEEYLSIPEKREQLIEESFLVWLNNQNPALGQFEDLITDRNLVKDDAYLQLIRSLKGSIHDMGAVGPGDIDLLELLWLPIRHSPDSILEQLRYIRLHWADLLEDSPFWSLLADAIILIQDEDRYIFVEQLSKHQDSRHPDFWMEKETHVPDYGDPGEAGAHYSADSSWMPEVVMLAKSTYVWLDQLSKIYHRHIARLQDIPDRELDLLSERGFTALWLIGLWQRSEASETIKRIQGNPEAKASAYALEQYNISRDIGGYEGYLDLRNRAMQRGIRLASDMVPNHTGIDSELVRNNPDWFLSASSAPYVNYSYNGPNLSSDARYGIFLEDGYWNRSDAAVTFKRVDYLNGDTRYIYHGNDGTTMPWNDTAQLDFLSAEVREGVIQQILHVARMFPIIRFDAAMVLAKRHIQRLWFPLHGQTAGVPSRSSFSMSMEEFNAAIPEEFWREVVDRIQAEVPGTLLLAEAFWMLEGYFVRTLGMHRVYNSAFMHMLKKEDNASYRYLIKNTLEFDAEILKRYVNFMNNPDEDTAIAQFGRGDKYFGVCMMMITMPGLPMLGHGQVEGFTEKYGMEYAKAYYDEQPDRHLVDRHYREIFPVMKKRPLFAEVENFFLYDVYSPEGSVNENIFAYSNRLGEEKALVIFNNCAEQAAGWISTSVGYRKGDEIRQTSLADGLFLSREDNLYVIFRDQCSGMEFIRSNRIIAEQGLFVALEGYRYNLFLDFREVKPSRLTPYDRLCAELNGNGTASIEHDVLFMSLEPLHRLLSEFLAPDNLAPLHGTTENELIFPVFKTMIATLLQEVAVKYGNLLEKPVDVPATLADETVSRFRHACQMVEEMANLPESDRFNAALGTTEREKSGFSTILLHWLALDSLQEMLRANELLSSNLIDDWLMSNTLQQLYSQKGLNGIPGDNIPDLLYCLLSEKPATLPADEESALYALLALLDASHSEHVARILQFENRHEKTWFREHRFSVLAAWLSVEAMLKKENLPVEQESGKTEHPVAGWVAAARKLDMQAFLSGYEMGALLRQKA